jgi:hypothetical protein
VAAVKADLQGLETQPVDLVVEVHLTTELVELEPPTKVLVEDLLQVLDAVAAAALGQLGQTQRIMREVTAVLV